MKHNFFPENRHGRRAAERMERPAKSSVQQKHKFKQGYKGQKFEVRCDYGDNKNYTVGWADKPEGVAALCAMVEKHPIMTNPLIIELTDEDKKALLNQP